MNGPTLAAVIVAGFAAYGAVIALLGRWMGRVAREQTTPVALSVQESERLWAELLETPRAPSVPRQFHAVGEPLTSADLDRIIASFEPCGSTNPTCRLHDPAGLCLPGTDTRCCPTCPTNPSA